MKDQCPICNKPFPVNQPRFLHFIRHIQAGEAIGRFDRKGTWWFEKSGSNALNGSSGLNGAEQSS